MSSRDGALDLLDDAADAVSRLGPWVGLLWLTALPARLLLVRFLARAIALGKEAPEYGQYLRQLAYAALGAWLVSLYGRLVFTRACQWTLQSDRPPARDLLRVPLRDLASYAAAAVAIEALFWALFFTAGAPLALLLCAGLAPAALEPRATPLSALRGVLRALGRTWRLVRLLLVFALALPFALLNVQLLTAGIVWLADGFPGAPLARFAPMLDLFEPLYALLSVAAVTLLLEPFWLASLASHAARLRAVQSGEDLQRWFERVKSA